MELTQVHVPEEFNPVARYGYNAHWHEAYISANRLELLPARVIISSRLYRIITPQGEAWAELSSRFIAARETKSSADENGTYPTAGDYALVRNAGGTWLIEDLLPRKSRFVRTAAGPKLRKQIVAANFDKVLIVTSLNKEFNMSRLERYMTAAWDSGGEPIIMLTKADLCEDAASYTGRIHANLPGVSAYIVSAVTGEGMEAVRSLIGTGGTAVLMGSSGVGKSTLVNALSGANTMEVNEIREDDAHGRHTTTHREVLVLPSGAIIIDTPGMREFGVWDGESSEVFMDIDELAQNCRFNDCKHDKEPGCAVRAALENGLIDRRRLRNYIAIKREEAKSYKRRKPR